LSGWWRPGLTVLRRRRGQVRYLAVILIVVFALDGGTVPDNGLGLERVVVVGELLVVSALVA
jgi:hypothetical protein